MVEKLKRDGFVAVVLTNDYGRGFSSGLDRAQRVQAMFDPVVAASLENMENGLDTDDLTDYLWNNYRWGGNLDDLGVEWIREGREFVVDEYDGAEGLRFRDEQEWIAA
jgi:hypothetical protein